MLDSGLLFFAFCLCELLSVSVFNDFSSQVALDLHLFQTTPKKEQNVLRLFLEHILLLNNTRWPMSASNITSSVFYALRTKPAQKQYDDEHLEYGWKLAEWLLSGAYSVNTQTIFFLVNTFTKIILNVSI